MPGTLDWLRTELKSRTRPNGTLTLNRLGHGLNNFGHYTEQFGASMAVSELLLQSVQQQGRLIVRAIEPILHEPGDEAGKSLPVRLNATVERLAQTDVRIRALFRPANVVGVKGFYYVAAAPATSASFSNPGSELMATPFDWVFAET